jgi:hypothetical protein
LDQSGNGRTILKRQRAASTYKEEEAKTSTSAAGESSNDDEPDGRVQCVGFRVSPPAAPRRARPRASGRLRRNGPWSFSQGPNGVQVALPLAATSGTGSLTSNWTSAADIVYTTFSPDFALEVRNGVNNNRFLYFTFNTVGYYEVYLALSYQVGVGGFQNLVIQSKNDQGVYVDRVTPQPTATT